MSKTVKNCGNGLWKITIKKVVVKRSKPQLDDTFWYVDAVEEAMCFGWIDSTTKRLENGVTAQKLTPRKKIHYGRN